MPSLLRRPMAGQGPQTPISSSLHARFRICCSPAASPRNRKGEHVAGVVANDAAGPCMRLRAPCGSASRRACLKEAKRTSGTDMGSDGLSVISLIASSLPCLSSFHFVALRAFSSFRSLQAIPHLCVSRLSFALQHRGYVASNSHISPVSSHSSSKDSLPFLLADAKRTLGERLLVRLRATDGSLHQHSRRIWKLHADTQSASHRRHCSPKHVPSQLRRVYASAGAASSTSNYLTLTHILQHDAHSTD
ncbi:hypothetical protein IQ07DRAFT_654328 [Pyrenochaeta sp. DS3sAY3a]|nr:hypothetical protein IQ07DRAFT_654328 [Pyrenochaeta sp. DS3sAY3a]